MRKVQIIAQPEVTVFGVIEIPDDVDNVEEYIDEHLDIVEYEEPDLDFGNMYYEVSSIT